MSRPSPEEQLQRWVDGDPVCPNTDGECCPDFGCCSPELFTTSREEREKLAAKLRARQRERMQ